MKRIVFLTGAGISAESGIPTFRGAIDGLWENHNVEEVATAKAIKEHPDVVYKFLNELRDKYKDCQPNSAHKAIAKLEKDYDVTVITQNIDDLHEKAGSTHVIHLHGDLSKVRAVNNTDLLFDYPEGGIIPGDTIDGHRVRPHVVLFGEDVPNYRRAIPFVKQADICVVIGTSGYWIQEMSEWVEDAKRCHSVNGYLSDLNNENKIFYEVDGELKCFIIHESD